MRINNKPRWILTVFIKNPEYIKGEKDDINDYNIYFEAEIYSKKRLNQLLEKYNNKEEYFCYVLNKDDDFRKDI